MQHVEFPENQSAAHLPTIFKYTRPRSDQAILFRLTSNGPSHSKAASLGVSESLGYHLDQRYNFRCLICPA